MYIILKNNGNFFKTKKKYIHLAFLLEKKQLNAIFYFAKRPLLITRTAWAVFKYCGTRLHHQEG
jgi:hypothetical protein